MVDVTAQSCTITPRNPTTLTGAGGVLASGTENVMIHCNCVDGNNMAVGPVRWYDPDGDRLVSSNNNQFNDTVPHFTRAAQNDNRNVILVIPTFTDSYDGTYTCGRRNSDGSLGTPSATITLSIRGDIFVYWSCILIVLV